MRTLIDIPDAQIQAMKGIARGRQQSRAAVIRDAVEEYLGRHQEHQVEEGFGLWGKRREDGLAYQKRMRKEW